MKIKNLLILFLFIPLFALSNTDNCSRFFFVSPPCVDTILAGQNVVVISTAFTSDCVFVKTSLLQFSTQTIRVGLSDITRIDYLSNHQSRGNHYLRYYYYSNGSSYLYRTHFIFIR